LLQALKVKPRSSQALACGLLQLRVDGQNRHMVAHEAKEMLKRAISLDDTTKWPFLLLGKIIRQEGKFGLAETYIFKAYELNRPTRKRNTKSS
jgi:Flp pilus assembly protein TadD